MRSLDSVSRRGLMLALGAGGVVLGSGRKALADPVFAEYPFQLGIAAGDPAPDGFVIWTRLAPRPLEIGHGMPSAPVPVKWEVATSRGFGAAVVRSGETIARPELGHAVHVEVEGLEPGRDYFYRFTAGAERTPSGRAKTAPTAGAAVARARFGVLGCQAYEQGFYTAHRQAAGEDLDFVYCYGDYIYEGRGNRTYTGSGGTIENPRQHLGGETFSLDDYRRRYAQYKLDTDLQASHAATAWFVTWDDHEIANNWVSEFDDGVPPEVFLLRRQAAAQAFYEHMPLRRSAFPRGAEMQLYRHAAWGDLLDLNFLDTRSHRSDQPCEDAWASTYAGVAAANAQVLGVAQEAWLYRNLDQSRARWKVLAQQIMVMDLDRKEGPEPGYNLDTWAGYSIPRQRLLDRLRERRIANTVVLTGDEHQNYAGELYRDSRNPEGAPIAAEFVTTSISSSGDGQDQRADGRRYLADNPFLKFNNAQRGYVVCDVTPERWQTEFKVLDKVSERGGTLTTRAKLAVASGDARVVAA